MKTSPKKDEYLLIKLTFAFIPFVFIVYFWTKSVHDRYHKSIKVSDSTVLQDRLSLVSPYRGIVYVRVNSIKDEYSLHLEYKVDEFQDVAEIGDSINKQKDSDILTLVKKNGKKYSYTFSH